MRGPLMTDDIIAKENQNAERQALATALRNLSDVYVTTVGTDFRDVCHSAAAHLEVINAVEKSAYVRNVFHDAI